MALALTKRYGVTFYDAAYHAIAIIHDGQFVTADQRYVSRASQAGAVVRLHDWSPPSSG
jgi:predicted nucleic acid-binding protein